MLNKYRLHFVAGASSPYAEEVPYAIEIYARNLRDAKLLANRMVSQGGVALYTRFIDAEEIPG